MSALSSQLTVAHARSLPAEPVRMESTEPRPMPGAIFHGIAEQLRALLLAQRSLSGQVGCVASAAEDDYRRFSNR